ncbi:hypothetical protein [Parapedobacter tibetensis]|uniref:hypothetical protein n=1 Tax=Parapedobacter tibetensis TaxID=2972951 RepID=UPI00214D4070|nr:hypothetical protein [Parapedobacter tibetensis]
MNRFIPIAIVLLCAVVLAKAQNLSSIRHQYRDATKSQEQAQEFYEQLQAVNKTDKPVLVAYKGSALTLLARYEKLAARGSKIKEAVQWIEQAVADEPNNAEIRLIRLSVQENLPKFLKYNQHIETDKQFVLGALPSIQDEELRAMIEGYIAEFSDNN